MNLIYKHTQHNLLRQSFHVIETRQDILVDSFYAHLFEHHPKLESLFDNTNWRKQKTLLFSLLALVVQYETNLDELESTLSALKEPYTAYCIKCHDYQAVYESLMMALCDTYGKHWDVPLEQAWCKAIRYLCDCMIKPQQKAA